MGIAKDDEKNLKGASEDDESKIAQPAISSQQIDQGFKGKVPTEEDLLMSELGKFNIKAEINVLFKRSYKYLQYSLQNNVRQRHNQKRSYDRITQTLTYLQ